MTDSTSTSLYLIIGNYGDSSEFYAPLWKYATMADAYVDEIHFRESSQLLSKREISAITGMVFLQFFLFHIGTSKGKDLKLIYF